MLVFAVHPSNIGSKYGRSLKCRARRKLRSEHVGVKPCPLWVLPACPWRWRAAPPHQPLRRRSIRKRRIPHRVMKSFSVRKRFPTSACPRSTSSTRNRLDSRNWARKLLPGAAGVAAAGVVAAAAVRVADAAGEPAEPAWPAEVAMCPGVRPGEVATPARRVERATALADASGQGRVVVDPAPFFLVCRVAPPQKRGGVAGDARVLIGPGVRWRASPMTVLPQPSQY